MKEDRNLAGQCNPDRQRPCARASGSDRARNSRGDAERNARGGGKVASAMQAAMSGRRLGRINARAATIASCRPKRARFGRRCPSWGGKGSRAIIERYQQRESSMEEA